MHWLVAGLGNPGPDYVGTRHNVGAMVVEELARRAQKRLRKQRFLAADATDYAEGKDHVYLARSHRFMNESGSVYAALARSHRVPLEHVIAVHDELDLPFGALQVRAGGGTAGHNGLKTLVEALRTPDFLRVRVGIGRPPGRQDPADFVLEQFRKAERDDVEILIGEAADAITCIVREGIERAQDRYNRSGPAR